MNKIVIIIANDSLYIEKGSFDFSFFLVFDNLNNNDSPQEPVKITLKLEKYLSDITLNLFNIVKIVIDRITNAAVGKDFEITFFKKLPLILSLLGSNASIKDGIPIVTTLIKVNCIGMKG